MAKKLYYKIGEACKHLDIQPYVLRYWETEFPMLDPDKSSSGQRVYNDRDLATIRRIKELLYDEGYTIAGAKKKLESEDLTNLEEKEGAGAAEAAPAAAKKSASKPASKKKASSATEAPAKKAAAAKRAAAGDGAAAKEVALLRKGVERALAQAREILDLLDGRKG